MAEPIYQPDVAGLADELRLRHGRQAFDVAFETARKHMREASWKHCAMWLQVVNRLYAAPDQLATAS